MKQTTIEKIDADTEITPEQLEQISKYTRRSMKPEELFVFSLILCDNVIDRDGERFPKESLDTLATLFLGKTGILDHDARSQHQCARIFKTQVVETKGEENDVPYFALKAWAYMVRSDENTSMILDIDAGIKKEVSVGCAVKQVLCSICGQDQRREPCSHQKGALYEGTVCHHLLVQPTDAYEWSFVAVPAQKNAGVVKGFGNVNESTFLEERLKSAPSSITLSKREAALLSHQLAHLKALADSGNRYRKSLQKNVIRTAAVTQPEMNLELLEEICHLLDVSQLETLEACYSTMQHTKSSYQPQLVEVLSQSHEAETVFQI